MTIFPIGVSDVTASNQRTVREAVAAAKRDGHAISYDCTEDHALKFVSARVLHYRSCAICQKDNETKAKINLDKKTELA